MSSLAKVRSLEKRLCAEAGGRDCVCAPPCLWDAGHGPPEPCPRCGGAPVLLVITEVVVDADGREAAP
jgi:hypothetical protein